MSDRHQKTQFRQLTTTEQNQLYNFYKKIKGHPPKSTNDMMQLMAQVLQYAEEYNKLKEPPKPNQTLL